jgi:ABC-type Fe3+/spermidine/putrescine transport system ATPase subunit
MSNHRELMLVVRGIYKSFGAVEVLKDVSAEIEKGELVTFVGPSGCGKTTLLRIIGGLTKPNAGDVILDGEVINHLTPDKRGTQMCFQNYALFPHMTVAGNVGYGLEVHKWERNLIRKRVEELLHLVQLDGLGGRPIEKLSGGQQQRVALARALALEPKVLLLDEPLSNLDANLRVQMRATLLEIQKRLNITTIFVTHDQSEAMSISDKIIVMNRGRVEQVGTPLEIYQKPSSEFIAGFVGFVNIIEAVVESIGKEPETAVVSTEIGNFEILPSEDDLSVGEKVFLVVRPEAIRIGAKGNGARANEYKGVVKSTMYEGSMVKYRVEVNGKLIIIDQFDPINQGFYAMGAECMVTLPQRVHILKK